MVKARVERDKEFEDPRVGLVGFGGGLGHGDPEMYRKPYELTQLARRGYRSNTRDAEANGVRERGSCDVAVLDGMALFVRREILDRPTIQSFRPLKNDLHIYGWPLHTPIGYFCYDYWLCCETRRQGYRIRMVGVACDHLNGKSTGLGPEELGRDKFEAAHRYLYDTCRDVLPWEVTR